MAFLYEPVGSVVCVATDDAPIDDDVFDGWLDTLASMPGWPVRALVWSGDGVPSIFQRSRLNEVSNRRPIRLAVMSDSLLARGAIQAFSWMSAIQVKGVPVGDFDGALDFLTLGPFGTAATATVESSMDADEATRLRATLQALHERACARGANSTRRSG